MLGNILEKIRLEKHISKNDLARIARINAGLRVLTLVILLILKKSKEIQAIKL